MPSIIGQSLQLVMVTLLFKTGPATPHTAYFGNTDLSTSDKNIEIASSKLLTYYELKLAYFKTTLCLLLRYIFFKISLVFVPPTSPNNTIYPSNF